MLAFSNRLLSGFRAQLQRFRKDERGVSVIEFTLVIPIMAILAVGSWELTKAVMTKRKNSNLATSVANLAAQDDSITDSDWATFEDIADKILFPYNNFAHRLGLIAVEVDKNGKLKEVCSYGDADIQTSELPAALRINNSFYIMTASEVDYLAFTKDAKFYGMNSGVTDMTFRDIAIFAPRNSDEISCD
ncbi:TadE/TadG family type IV pilus assembly protein [uncultured Cohaesibacter sp.]|uniref:TadE/TadG family type IV pilus assembly protein n=1 Tax=uncultured Cohaesibacter sp. TaxID=1002546 RepID=UPI0029C676C3|nr:TadE/TadG family type IV pilus assembly protein [uncultured Cohaesibacter sp.]